jgi:localization factor PodJL
VGLILAGAALFYLVRDAVFAPNREPAVIDVPPAPGEDLAPESSLLETPAPPMVDPRALYLEAMEALNAGEGAPSEAIAKLEEAAALGHPPAQLQLGEFYKTGQGVEQDLPQARVWFRRAANGGNILAMHRIGVMMARGDGGPADAREAIDWFERAGNHGLVDSQYNLGAIYHPSEDSASSSVQDAGQAYYWYSLAVKNGDEQAAQLAKGIGALLSAEQKSALDESIAAWEAIPADEAANELAPAAG